MRKMMRALVGAAMLAGLAVSGTAQQIAAIVPAGTEVELMVMAEVTARSAKPGDVVRLRLNKPVEAGGVIVLPVGTAGFGEVLSSEKSGIALKRGKLGVRLTHLQLGDRAIPLDGNVATKGKGGDMDDAAKIILVPFYVLFSPGNSAKLKAGELIQARLGADVSPSGEPSAPR